VHSERQVIGHNSTKVRTQAVANARELVHVQAGSSQMRQHDRHTPSHRLEIVNGGRVTRDCREFTPVHHEHIVLSVVQVRCKSDETDLKKKNCSYNLVSTLLRYTGGWEIFTNHLRFSTYLTQYLPKHVIFITCKIPDPHFVIY